MTIAQAVEADKYFLGNVGIESLSRTLTGKENIYLGIRPFGFHAGNLVPLYVYPYLLCEKMREYGNEPAFNFYLFLNDYEQHAIEGPNTREFPFNILPQNTTIQYTYLDDTDITYSDYWSPIIIEMVRKLCDHFPEVSVVPILNSQMRLSETFQYTLLRTMREPSLVVQSVLEATNHKMLPQNHFAVPISPYTKKPDYAYKLTASNTIVLSRGEKGEVEYTLEELDYWFYHKPLALPRLADYKIDLCITGLDHLYEGDFLIRKRLIENYGLTKEIRDFHTLYTPLIRSHDGVKMGKSNANSITIPATHLINVFREHGSNMEVEITPWLEEVGRQCKTSS